MENKKKTFYITTPIYYPSGNLHIGHLYTTSLAWVLKNYKKKMNYDVMFITGSDEHGQKIEKKAKEAKMDCQQYVDEKSTKFLELWKAYNIDFDFFSRTTNQNHKNLVSSIFNQMLDQKLIYKSFYQGLYSIEDEEFILESQAIKKDQNFYHPVSQHKLQLVEEESYFFDMKKFNDWLLEYLNKNPNWIIPNKVANELKNNFLNKDLENLSITRISFTWGIPIQSDPKHVIYVWLDALFNYLSALGFQKEDQSQYLKFWANGDEIVHIIGKEISRFHCIYWPIFLKSLDLKLPTKIISHGWIITPEGKMSKSKNNVIDPLKLLNHFNHEVVKYYFVSKMNINNDNVFSEELVLSTYNAEIVNTYGNLVSRTLAMINKNFTSAVKYQKTENQDDIFMEEAIAKRFKEYQESFDQYEIHKAFEAILDLGKDANKYIDQTLPWTLTNDLERLAIILNILLNVIYAIFAMLEVVMPQAAQEVRKLLNIDHLSFDHILDFHKFDAIKVGENKIIFPRKK